MEMTIKERMMSYTLREGLRYLEKDPEHNIPKLMALVDRLSPASLFPSQRDAIRRAIEEKNNWYQLIMKSYGLDANVRNTFFESFLVNANLIGWQRQEAMRDAYGCNIPWAVLLDPTSACNLHCTGCWAAEYGNKLNLTYADIDSIIRQAEELGCYFFIYTGGEPLVRKADIIRLCEAHPEAAFMGFTNGTLVDQQFCDEMKRVGNFIPVLSVEGPEDTTDARRGHGVYHKVTHAMDLLRENKLLFGISACVTRENEPYICSEEYFQQMIDWGALFCWFFTFMPVGVDSSADLVPTGAQRAHMFKFIRAMRDKMPLFTMDFWGDSEFVGGCIAGGRRYLHINAQGDVDPCVFSHYSNMNIHDHTLLECLQSPIFMAYHDNQPFNENLMLPCPILDNIGRIAEMVDESGAHSTDLQAPEDAHDLAEKCRGCYEDWAPYAAQLWDEYGTEQHHREAAAAVAAQHRGCCCGAEDVRAAG